VVRLQGQIGILMLMCHLKSMGADCACENVFESSPWIRGLATGLVGSWNKPQPLATYLQATTTQASFKDDAQYLESVIIIPKTAEHFIAHVHPTIYTDANHTHGQVSGVIINRVAHDAKYFQQTSQTAILLKSC
jgi:hypothetical protein